MTELERALGDIAEVRDRLAAAQRFKGYSGLAAIISGIFALAAGVVQAVLIGMPRTVHDGRVYFAIWFVCCALSLAINYGAIAHWFVNDASARDRWQTRTVGFSILPAVLFGAALSLAMLRFEGIALLPGIWYGIYGIGLIASRLTVPRGVLLIGFAFLALGFVLLFVSASIALQPWTMAAGFGAGQIAIGILVVRERNEIPS
ncbi:MAG: hypothetical protein DLM50_00530 [Candidatus Meridianibacter frigidus]|nr:MAG: hypothetical protein DLM50_00530 [Candidatus Eremiobacteraeota bacterium]